MFRTRAALVTAACLAGAISGSVAIAQADSTGSTGSTAATSVPATITVNGAGDFSVDSTASTATIQADYLTALSSALTDAHTHASTLSAAVGDTLGVVQNITEESNEGNTACSGPIFAEGKASGAPVPTVAPTTSKKKHHSSKPSKTTAHIADDTTTTCTVEADVTVTYAMVPS